MITKIVLVRDHFWNRCRYQTNMLYLLLHPLLTNLFLATFVYLFAERSSITILPTVLTSYALYVKHHNLATFLKIVLNARL